MELLCEVSDREIFENESEYENYITTFHKKNNKCFFLKNILLIMLKWMNSIKF